MSSRSPGGDIGLCLSGGGYRAMVFHVGALIRINEAGLLPRLRIVSSVSGGSITAAWLGLRWRHLTWDNRGVAINFGGEVVEPLLRFAGRGMDISAVVSGGFVPGVISRRVQRIYRKRLFGDARLADLPGRGEGPEFVITATNLGNGSLWRFGRFGVGDFPDREAVAVDPTSAGFFQAPEIPVAVAVAASSAFPPILSPCILDVSKYSESRSAQRTVRLSDGGLYDNLGLQPLAAPGVRVVLCSDGGAPFKRTAKPPRTFLRGTVHVLKVVDLQVRKRRKFELIGSARRGERQVGFWAIDGRPEEYVPQATGEGNDPIFDVLAVTDEARAAMYGISTRLAKMSSDQCRRLANWGYALSDAAIRRYVHPGPPGSFPFDGGVG